MSFHLPVRLDERLLSPIRKDLEETRNEIVKAVAGLDTGRQILTELSRPDLYAPTGQREILMRLYRGPDGPFLDTRMAPTGRLLATPDG